MREKKWRNSLRVCRHPGGASVTPGRNRFVVITTLGPETGRKTVSVTIGRFGCPEFVIEWRPNRSNAEVYGEDPRTNMEARSCLMLFRVVSS